MTNETHDTDLICKEAVELLLASMSKNMGTDGLRVAFMFGRPGEPTYQRSLGTEFFYSPKGILAAVLYIRRHGPAHLRQMAVKDIQAF
jgi:hypothetical protein